MSNPACGDYVELELQADVNGDMIHKARFEARGCIISQAASSILCEFIEGKGIVHVQQFTPHQMLDLLRIPLSPRRMQCGLLPFRALKALLYSIDEGNRE